MTDNDIIKTLKECLTEPCGEQAYINAVRNALDLINRKEANIEGLTNAVKYLNEQLSSAKAEAVKKFAEKLKEKQQTFIGDEYTYKFIIVKQWEEE